MIDRASLQDSLLEIALLYPQSDATAVATALKQRGLVATEQLIVEAWEALGLATREARQQFARQALRREGMRKKTLAPKAPSAPARTAAPVSQACSADRDTLYSPSKRDD